MVTKRSGTPYTPLFAIVNKSKPQLFYGFINFALKHEPVKYTFGIAVITFLLCFCTSCKENSVWYTSDFKVYHAKARELYANGQKVYAKSYLDSVHDGLLRISPDIEYMYFSFQVMYYSNSRDIDSAVIYADSAVALLEYKDRYKLHSEEYVHALMDKGYALSLNGENDKACEAYVKAERVSSSTLDPCSRNEYNYHVAMALYKQGKLRLALQYFDRAFKDAETCTGPSMPCYRMQEILDNMGLCYGKLEKYDSSLLFFDSGLVFIDKHSREIGGTRTRDLAKAVLYKNMGSCMAFTGRLDSAEKMLWKCINIAMQPGYDSSLGLAAEIVLTGVYQLFGHYSKMYAELKKTKPAVENSQSANYILNWKEWLFIYYDSTAKYKKAIGAYADFIGYRDSVRKSEERTGSDILTSLKDKQQQYQITILRKDNEVKKAYLLAAVGACILLLVITVMGRQFYYKSKQKNKLISSQKDELERSNREKDRILHVVAHDLRNPIGSISYMADSMLMAEDLSEQACEATENIKKASSQSLDLVNELLAITDAKIKDMTIENVEVVALVRSCVASFQHRSSMKGQLLTYEEYEEPIYARLDEKRIVRALNNLIDNAIKFSQVGGQVIVGVKREHEMLVIRVTDTGIGIPNELLPGLFEMFTESKRRGTSNEKSYGLGLFITRQIVEQHRGTLGVITGESSGSSFVIRLPTTY